MEESKDLKQLYSVLQGVIFLSIFIEFFVLIIPYLEKGIIFDKLINALSNIFIWQNIFYSKIFTFIIVLVVTIGSKPKKDHLITRGKILIPILTGLSLFVGSIFILSWRNTIRYYNIGLEDYLYLVSSMIGALLLTVGFDNVSKLIKTSLGKDRFNLENESFLQPTKKIVVENKSVNIPITFRKGDKIMEGWMNILDVFRGSLVAGVPGSGKSFSIIIPYIKQLLGKGFSALIYDYKYPDLAEIAYHHYKINKKKGTLPKNTKFHVINLDDVEYSRRVNPLKPEYINTLAEAQETAEGLVLALLKTGKAGGGAEQFFTQSAINFLAAVIYYLSKFEGGKYSTFAHVLEFSNQKYEDMFNCLFSMDELQALVSPFREAYEKETFEQLDAQIGTLKINISRLANKETYWVFNGDDVELKISDHENPSIIILANNEKTNSVNAASNALVLNRITKLINTKGNRPCLIAVDEFPTIYFHQIDKLIATARSNKVAVLLGLQELPQLEIGYSKDVARNIISVIGNVFSGAVRNKQTLEWLVTLFGKIKQTKQGISISKNSTTISLNESMDNIIPASKISSLKAGEMVAKIANTEVEGLKKDKYDYDHGMYHCKMNIDVNAVIKEEEKYTSVPKYYNFKNKETALTNNFNQIRKDIQYILTIS